MVFYLVGFVIITSAELCWCGPMAKVWKLPFMCGQTHNGILDWGIYLYYLL